MPSFEHAPNREEMAEAISDEMVRIHRENYGHGAARVETHIVDSAVISILDGVELAPNEEVLIAAGRNELVREIRQRFQASMESTFRAAVERATGREVVAFVSDIHLEPNFMLELFRLGPNRPNGLG